MFPVLLVIFVMLICLPCLTDDAALNYLFTVYVNLVLYCFYRNLPFLMGMRRMLRLVLYLVFLSIKVACVSKIEYELRRVVWKNRISGLHCCQLAKSLTTYCSSIGIKLKGNWHNKCEAKFHVNFPYKGIDSWDWLNFQVSF